MTINNEFEIMIVGGGPAGISTWLHLQKYNPELAEKTILIEKERYPREKLCGGAVGGWSENLLKSLGVRLGINSIMIDTVECCFKDKKYVYNEKNYFRIVHRKEFDHFLANAAFKRGLEIHEEEKFLDFKRKTDYVIVETNNDKYKIKALIGADGSLSKVRKKINNEDHGHLASTIEIFSPLNPKNDKELEEKKVVFDFTPINEGLQGYVWHFPCLKENRFFMNHGIVNFRINNTLPSKHMKTIFTNELSKRNISSKDIQFLSHPIRCFSNEGKISESNVLLVGDAAGIEPATGGGIHLALSYGELAANVLVKSFKSGSFLFGTYIDEFNHSMIGRYINKLSYLADGMYCQGSDPLTAVSKIFNKQKE